MQIVFVLIVVFLVALAVFLLWGAQRLWRSFAAGIPPADEVEEDRRFEQTTLTGPLGPDELVFLFPEMFVGTPDSAAGSSATTGTAPLSDEAVDLRDEANRLLYAILADQHQSGRLEFRLVEHAPSMAPPFPHKNWELEVRRADVLSSTPLLDCLNVAFNLIYKRRAPGVGDEKPEQEPDHEPEQLWISLNELVEQVLKVARAEISFWKRQGVYGDLCNYVEEALIGDGYMRELPRVTWLERLRSRRLEVNRAAIEARRADAEALHRRLAEFRRTHGSEQTREMAEDLTSPSQEADSELGSYTGPPEELPLDDALRLSIYETLYSLRQLEPSGGA